MGRRTTCGDNDRAFESHIGRLVTIHGNFLCLIALLTFRNIGDFEAGLNISCASITEDRFYSDWKIKNVACNEENVIEKMGKKAFWLKHDLNFA